MLSDNGNKNHLNGSYFQGPNGYNGITNYNERDDPDEINLQHLFYMLWGHKWIILGSIIVCMLVAGVIAELKTPIYESQGSLLIKESKNQYSYAGSDIANLLTNSYGIGVGSSIADELQILQSRKLSQEIADTLRKERLMPTGNQYPVLFNSYPDDSTMALKDTVAFRIRQNISFKQVDQQSNLVDISYKSPSPIEAAHIVNLSIKLYSELSTRQNRKSARAAVSFLEGEQTRIEHQLSRAELELQHYREQNKLVQVDAQTQSMIDRVTQMEQTRQGARTQLVAVNAALKQYQDQLDEIKPGLADQLADAVGADMERLQYQLAEFKTARMKMLSENPQLKNSNNPPEQLQTLNRQIKDYQDKIRSLTNNLLSKGDQYLGLLSGSGSDITQNISDLNKKIIELKVQQQQYESQDKVLTGEITKINKVFDNLPANMTSLARLERNVKIDEVLYETVSQQHAQMALWQQTQFGEGQLVDEGYIPDTPVEPNKKLYVLVGFVLGGIMGIGYVFVKESFNTSIDGVQKLKQFEVPMLAVVPDIQNYVDDAYKGQDKTMVQGSSISTRMISILNTVSPAAESFRRLESNILHSNPDAAVKSLMVTSTTKGEGKTTIAANLAVIMAEADQKIIVIDTDLRRPNLHQMFGMERSPGLVDVLFEETSLEEAIRPTIVPNLSVLCGGKRPPNASAITKSASFLALVKKLEQRFDKVIIDTPPFGIITDSSALIDQTDGVVVVSKFKETHIGELEHTLHQLKRIGAKVFGTVLNGFDAGQSSDYYYGNNYYKEFYGDYAAYEDEVI